MNRFSVHCSRLVETDSVLYSKYLDTVKALSVRDNGGGVEVGVYYTASTSVMDARSGGGVECIDGSSACLSEGVSGLGSGCIPEHSRRFGKYIGDAGDIFEKSVVGVGENSVDAGGIVSDPDGVSSRVHCYSFERVAGIGGESHIRSEENRAVSSGSSPLMSVDEKRRLNRERNKKRRQVRAEEKRKKSYVSGFPCEGDKGKFAAMRKDWRSTDGGDMIKQDQTPGTFWNSTSKQVRQELIDSKAKMHIAENKRREREALDKIAYLESPEAAMHKAIGMIDYAQKQAKKENDNKVYGWAKTVATSSAESLARSTPDSVPSFDEVSARIDASIQSSLELELKAKQDELDDERRKIALLENEIREEKRAKEEVVAKSKHEAVVHRMRQLETQISENNKKAERVNFRSNRVEEMRNAQGETEKQMRARMAKLSPEEHQREVVRLMRERAWENS